MHDRVTLSMKVNFTTFRCQIKQNQTQMCIAVKCLVLPHSICVLNVKTGIVHINSDLDFVNFIKFSRNDHT